MEVRIRKTSLEGNVKIPSSKSHSIRALLIATLADGESRITGLLDSSDTRSCRDACLLLGADIRDDGRTVIVKGTGGKPAIPADVINTGNSGTTEYLAAAVACLSDGWTVFTGDDQIRRRPVENLLAALRDLGAEAFTTLGNGCAPFVVKGPLKGGKTSIECPTSQFLSGLLLASPCALGDTEITVPLLYERPYVDITLSWLEKQNIRFSREGYDRFFIPGGQRYRAFNRAVPADFSSATFFFCAAAITGSRLTLEGLDNEDPQGDKAVMGILEEMGCKVLPGPSGITIEGGKLKAGTFDLNATPDALPALSVTACFAEGTTRLVNVPQARLKETDRIAVMAKELPKLGARVTELSDGLEITGSSLTGARVHGHGDHRVVMSLALAGLGASGETVIDTAEAAAVTFPEFFTLLESIQTDKNRIAGNR